MRVDRTPAWAWQLANAWTLLALAIPAYPAERQFAARFEGRLAWYHRVGLMALGLTLNLAVLILAISGLALSGWIVRQVERAIRRARRARSRPQVDATSTRPELPTRSKETDP